MTGHRPTFLSPAVPADHQSTHTTPNRPIGSAATTPLDALLAERGAAPPVAAAPFRRLAITNVFGDPLAPGTWSGAPHNLAAALRRLGVEVAGIHARVPRGQLVLHASHFLLSGYGELTSSEAIMRGPIARGSRARVVAGEAIRLGADAVLHTGTLDLPAASPDDGLAHYLYCDQTWDLSLRHRPDVTGYSGVGRARFEELERRSYAAMRHIFTFGRYVRDNLVRHYGVPASRVTVVGSGMGAIQPYAGPKDYEEGPLLFVAKHLFEAKGGPLALEAFRRARRRRPGLRMIVAGNERWHELVGPVEGVHVLGHLPWHTLEELYRSARLLVQPMLNDPWGQVYLEALVSRTPVVGLHRNGLPEITDDGRLGFLVERADPDDLAEAILEAVDRPDRLARMGEEGQAHVVARYSWDRVARAILEAVSHG